MSDHDTIKIETIKVERFFGTLLGIFVSFSSVKTPETYNQTLMISLFIPAISRLIPFPGENFCHIVLKISGYVRCGQGDDH